MIIGLLTERGGNELRSALVPGVVPRLREAGHEVWVESGAGESSGYTDAAFLEKGATVHDGGESILEQAGIIPLLGPPTKIGAFRDGQIILGLLNPLGGPEIAGRLADQGLTSFALELLPRTSRAQAMDALTSTATVAGYKSVLVAAAALDKMFPLMMTAAGTISPARVLVIGAGVAGLQAIATARRLGAVVEAYDVRPAVKEQIESLGARFLELSLETSATETASGYARTMDESFYLQQQAFLRDSVRDHDIVITTAAIPGQPAPLLITADAVRGMRRGSIVVDLASDTGGNCELTRAGETVRADGVTVIGPLCLASTVPHHASQMYARNVTAFLLHITDNGALQLDMSDEITRESLLTHKGEVVSARVREMLGLPREE